MIKDQFTTQKKIDADKTNKEKDKIVVSDIDFAQLELVETLGIEIKKLRELSK